VRVNAVVVMTFVSVRAGASYQLYAIAKICDIILADTLQQSLLEINQSNGKYHLCFVESHNLSAKYCARDHHRGHRNGFNGRIHRLCEMFRLRVQI
jgi:hypothetical protein